MQVKFMREEIMRAINIVNRGVTKDTVVALGGIMIYRQTVIILLR